MSLPSRIGIDMDENRNFHSQQDCPGCVDDEANIVNKCDARRQVVSGNEMFSLSKEWERSISVLTAVYGVLSCCFGTSSRRFIFSMKGKATRKTRKNRWKWEKEEKEKKITLLSGHRLH